MPSTLIIFLIIAPILAYFYYISLKGRAKWEKQNTNARLDEVSKRLKLEIVQGDPNFNLVVTKRSEPFAPKEANVILKGTTYSHPIELFYHDKRWTEETLLGTTRYHEFDSRLAITSLMTLPSFEISSRNPGMGITIETHLHLPESSFFDPSLDESLLLGTSDPELGKRIAPVLRSLPTMGYVHIVAQGNQLTLVMNEIGMVGAMGQIDQWVLLFESIICVLEGKPVPGAYQGQINFSESTEDSVGADTLSGMSKPTVPPLPGLSTSSSTQIPIPCKTCGAAMKEIQSAHLHEPVKVVCEYCGSSETVPGDKGERVLALRTRLAQMKWAEDAAKGMGLAMAQITEGGYWIAMLLLALVLVGTQIYSGYSASVQLLERLANVDTATRLRTLQEASPFNGFGIGIMFGVFFGTLTMWLTYRKGLRPKLLARPALLPDHGMRCRQCGGELPTAVGAFITCIYCQAQNLVSPDIAKNQAALLEKETKEYRRRAAEGHKEMKGLAQNALTSYYIFIGAGVVFGIILGAVLKTLLIHSIS